MLETPDQNLTSADDFSLLDGAILYSPKYNRYLKNFKSLDKKKKSSLLLRYTRLEMWNATGVYEKTINIFQPITEQKTQTPKIFQDTNLEIQL